MGSITAPRNNTNTPYWRIRCIYYTDVVTVLHGTNAKRGEVSVITFPKNVRRHILGMEFSMVPVTNNYPFHTSDYGLFLQNFNQELLCTIKNIKYPPFGK